MSEGIPRQIWLVSYQGNLCSEVYDTKQEAKEDIEKRTIRYYTKAADYKIVKFKRECGR